MIKFKMTKSDDPLSDIELETALKKIPSQQLAMLTFKRLDDHIRSCSETSDTILKILKPVGLIVGMMALEKLNEMFHIVKHLPAIGG